MRLKKIQIQGFKSFAEKTTLEFGWGVTAVVGPNGCGKSNIADAFRWVLGEQSARSMRGLKMQDVIFEGTSKRAALNFAEVSITLTEVGGALPIQYEEVTITRRLHRSGESTYLLNGQPVRLKDLQDLFADSGIGKNTLSIFEQGKIEQVINHTPLERRSIFWEAAGIIRFLQSKRDAKLKLDEAEGNVSRLKDIHHEVEYLIVVLRELAVKAAEYKEQKSRSEELEKSLFVKRWDLLRIKIKDLLEKENGKQAQLENASTVLKGLEEKITLAKDALQVNEQEYRSRSEELFKVRSDKEIKNREKQLSEERKKELLVKEKRWQQEVAELTVQRLKRASELNDLRKKQQNSEQDLAILEANRQAQKSKVLLGEAEVAKLREKQQLTHKENLDLVRHEAQLHSEIKQNLVRQENSGERKVQQTARLDKLVHLEKELSAQCLEKQNHLNEVTKIIDDQRASFHALEKKVEERIALIQQRQNSIDLMVQEMNEA
ncbi:MAG: AAA family ATPase, partial [Parachlamydiaceae bacterium]|nr:AAA family ATPase [Parachlamydiaceae bacterium]